MNDLTKSKDDLIQELRELRKEHESLKASYDKDITECKEALAEVQEAGNRFRLLFQSVNFANSLYEVVWDKNGSPCDYRFLEVNPIFEENTGKKAFELIGKTLLEVFPKTEHHWLEKFEQVVNTGIPIRFEEYSKELDTHVELNIYLPKKGQLAWSSMDITERKLVEVALRESEERFRNLLGHLEAGIVVHAADTSVIMNNPKASVLLGLSDDQMRGKQAIDPAWKFLHEDYTPLSLDEYPVNRIVNIKKPINDQIYGIQQPGTNGVVWVTVNGFPVLNKTGEIAEIVISFIDITNRKQAEEEIVESEKRFRTIFENSMVGKSITNIDGTIKTNLAFCEIVGYSEEELSKLNWQTITHPDDVSRDEGIVKTIISGDKLYDRWEKRYIRKNGDLVWVDISTTLQRDKQGKPLYFITSIIDITERKKIEEALQKSAIELRKAQKITHIGSWNLDLATNDVIWTQELYKMYGFDSSLPPPPYTEHQKLFTPESWEVLSSSLAKSRETGTPYELELKTVRKDGSNGWMWVRGETVTNTKGDTIGLWGAAQDITERKKTEDALRESEEQYRNLVEIMPDGVYKSTHEGKFVEVNPAMVKLLGYESKEELMAIDIKTQLYFALSDRESVVLQENKEEIGVYRMKKKDGSEIWVEDHGCLNFDEKKNVLYHEGIMRDITERKKADEKIKKSEAQLSNALDIAQLGHWEYDVASDTFTFNDQFYNIFRTTVEQEGGYTMTSAQYARRFVHPDDALQVGIETRKAIETTDPNFSRKIEHRFIYADGELGYINVHFFIIKDEQGRTVKTYGVNQDITQRKLAEQKLREKDVQFRKLSSNLPDLIYQFTRRPDGTYCVPIASEGIKNIFGCSPEDVVEDFSPIGRVIYSDDLDRVIGDIEYSAEHLTYFTCEFRVQIPNKPIQWIFSRSTPEKLADGSITWYGFNANITEMKQTEFDLTRAKEKSEESDRLKSAFLANMSHEIRTPMNGILGFTQLLKEPELTGEEQAKFISVIEKSGARLLNIINDIVNMSKIEAGLMETNISEANVNEKIEFIYNFFKPEAELKKIHFTFNHPLPAKEAIIKTDPEKIYAILTNLVSNAMKFTHEGSIEFGYEKKGKYLEFYVKDTGIGISQQHKEIIFERFRQADKLNFKNYEGTGLGLSISKSYVEMLGGTMWVESEFGKGATFYFTIPYNIETEKKEVNKHDPSAMGVEPHVKNLKILIAEDDENSEILLTAVVKKISHNLLHAVTGVEAVEACRNNPGIDLVLMDITMPDLNGYEATRQIRTFNKDVVIIAQTAYALAGDREKAMEAGCNDYISKPLNHGLLLGLIQKYFK